MQITIDTTKCCGSGQCVMSAPNVFDQDDEGIAFLIVDPPDPSERPNVEEAVVSCPTGAIALADG